VHPTEDREQLYIGGEFRHTTGGRRIEVINPFSGDVVGAATLASAEDVDAAVQAARDALAGEWATWTAADRAALLSQIADGILAQSDRLGALVTAEMGAPIGVTRNSTGADGLRYYADLGREFAWEQRRDGPTGPGLVRRVPTGVAALIVPWNSPFGLLMQKVAPALMSGCTIVAKPSPETPLDAFVLADVLEQTDIPPGVVNIVPADAVVGEHLVRHNGVDKVSFTGSTAAGKRVAAACAERMARCTAELGGKSAAIILDDANLDLAIPQISAAGYRNNGQACIALTRVLAPENLYDEVVERLADAAKNVTMGDPMDPSTMLGPLVNKRQHDRVMGYIDDALSAPGVTAAAGGKSGEGLFVEATILAGVRNEMKVSQEEVFGPVQAVISYADTDEAVEIANDSSYGLSGSVWSGESDRALAVARQIRTGTITVNGFRLDRAFPFGGFKESGTGRENGPEGLDSYLELQSVFLPGQ
jgi:aldehyde dehydrogenase (NAD+)